MPQTIHLVRHGEVENPKGIIYGRLPGFRLSERGRQQAAAAGRRLADADVGAIWASPLERAQETAQAIAEVHGLPITTDDRLLESLSAFEGVGKNVLKLLGNPAHWWHLRNPMTAVVGRVVRCHRGPDDGGDRRCTRPGGRAGGRGREHIRRR